MNIHDFDAIRPLLPEEIPAAIEALFAEPQFCSILQSFYKDIPQTSLHIREQPPRHCARLCLSRHLAY